LATKKSQRGARPAAIAAVLAAAGACSDGGSASAPPPGLRTCAGDAVLTQSPVPLSALEAIVPLGNLNPSGHVFPTDHLYLGTPPLADGSPPTAVVAPADIVIVSVGRQSNSGGGRPASVDYTLHFYPCADVMFYFYHLTSLDPELLARVGSFDGGCNPPYVTGGGTYQQCFASVTIALSAGAPIGAMGGPSGGSFDLGGHDRRTAPLAYVAPGRTQGGSGELSANHTICPIDYFVPAVADPMRALLGRRGTRRTIEPVCGTVMQDRADTAQGRWYAGDAPMEDPHLALVHDNVDPTLGAFSVGTSIPDLPSAVYAFTPAASGPKNADFGRVGADGTVYCYDAPERWWGGRHILLRMPTPTTLEIAAAAGATCDADPAAWTVGGGATRFER
jgi:hypothetical protein